MDRFAEQGGLIGLRVEADKVRFDINVDAAQRTGLTMSSQLLKLARVVRSPFGKGT
jgi:YfiR/HmsC-like